MEREKLCSGTELHMHFTFLILIKIAEFLTSDIEMTKPFIQQWLPCPSSTVT